MADTKDIFLKGVPGPEKVLEGTITKQDEGGYIAACSLCGQRFAGKQKVAKNLLDDHFVHDPHDRRLSFSTSHLRRVTWHDEGHD